MTNCVFSGNTASEGGGIYNNTLLLYLTNCILVNNTASNNGGGINTYSGSLMVTNCTFNGNKANNCGGGIIGYCSLEVTNCILWGDSATTGSEIFNIYGITTFNQCNIRGCDIQGSGGSAQWNPAMGNDCGGNIVADPQFVNATNPAGPDGLWRTSDDGLILLGSSPCINKGTDFGVLPTDILGNPRVGAPDIGAYEYQSILNAGVRNWTFYR
jgi:predicted outer membrane repeat protein